MSDKTTALMATVYLKSRSGRSLLRERTAAPIDPQPYLPSSTTIEKAVAELRRLGFTIEARGITLSISGPPELFERTCGVRISREERMIQGLREAKPRKMFFFKSSQSVMYINNLNDVIDGIVISTPGFPFEGHASRQ